jgi:hypothetical protein
MRAHDSILFRREKAPPFFIGMGHLKRLALHGLSLPWGLRIKPHTSAKALIHAYLWPCRACP